MSGGRARSARAAVGRADLVRLAAELPPERLGGAAALLGFEEERERPEPVGIPIEMRPGKPAAPLPRPEAAPAPTPMPFWRLEEMTFTDPPEPKAEKQKHERPDEELRLHERPLDSADLESPGRSLLATPRAKPLTPWSRLWPVLRAALQASAPGRDPDLPALTRAWARGDVVRRVPRLQRRVWTDRASVWVDRSRRLVPFWSDQDEVCRRLRDTCGKGLQFRVLNARTQAWSIAGQGDLRAGFRADSETPVLVLGDLGIYGAPAERAAWLRTARRLRAAEVRVAALVPAPAARWNGTVTRAWEAAPWERGRRRAAGSASARREQGYWQARAERLLCIASPAAFVQPGLLRAMRLLLPAAMADAASEADAWNHADVCAADATGMVLHPEAALRWREEFAGKAGGGGGEVDDALRRRVSTAIGTWHERLPRELLRGETLAWLGLVSPEVAAPPGKIEDAIQFAARMQVSLERGMEDRSPAAAMVRRCARTMLLSMPAGAYEAVPALQRVWAVAFHGVAGVRVPEGLHPEALRAELELGGAGEPRWWAVRQVGGELVLSPSPDAAWPSRDEGPGSPIAWMLAAGPHVYVSRGEGGSETQIVLEDGLRLSLHAGEGMGLRSDRCVATLGCWSREPWAVAAGRDAFGLWADAEVEGTVMRFRWVPPGRFRMGSPEGEAGRWADEGPQHTVTWTEGRWLGETPVTQAVWEAVMGGDPSEFVSSDRPVEQVSWNDCQGFIERLNELVPGLGARLPSEAEWEHACRAGTETATWVGDLEILGENNAPLLDAIAWYGGNSGTGFDLENGWDSSGWPGKQYEHSQAGTCPVCGRLPNPLGLYDMLGNVFEWCLDTWEFGVDYVGNDVVDPEPNSTGSNRVIRGGCWNGNARFVRAAFRCASLPENRLAYLGFRLARGQEPGRVASPGPRSGRRP